MSRQPKALIVGIDGLRPDAMKVAETPNLDRLIAEGAFADNTQNMPDRKVNADTISGACWSSILTGVWPDKHGVPGNDFGDNHFDRYPHFFKYVKLHNADAFTASVVTWHPLGDNVVRCADANERGDGDDNTTDKAIQLLYEPRLDVLFVDLDDMDLAGHQHTYGPQSKGYVAAIAQTDARVGRLVQAVRSRKSRDNENWLIVVTSDHGGVDNTHANGVGVPEVQTVFLILSGPSARRGRITEQTYIVDIVPTLLSHLGVPIAAEWGLDGQAVGLA